MGHSACGLLALLAAGCSAAAQGGRPPDRSGPESFACSVARVSAGNVMACAERASDGRRIGIRLDGIVARGRGATAQLQRLTAGQVVMCRRTGPDRRRGPATSCRRADGTDLACAMVARGAAGPSGAAWQPRRCLSHPDVGRERIMDRPRRP